MTVIADISQLPSVELTDSTPLLGQPKRLLERAAADGYLFFRGLLDRDKVLGVRRQVMQVVADHGWLAAGTDVLDGIADLEAFDREDPQALAFCGTGLTAEAYRDVYRIQDFHGIGHDPALLGLYDGLLGGHVLRQPLSIARVMIPGKSSVPTPPHQDFIHIQGTKNVWTAWFPLGDCPVELGGLTVLVGSHADGLLTYHAAQGAGELEAYICNSGYNWGVADFRAGDVLTFTSLTVHRSQPNLPRRQVRLSVDLRYQRDDEPIAPLAISPHCGMMTWDEVYDGWTDESLQYYWTDRDLQVVDWDESLRWQKHKIC